MRIANYDALSAAVMGVATITSDPIDISASFGYAVHCIWTGTPTGTLTLEASCQENAPTAFETISGTSVSLVGAAGAQPGAAGPRGAVRGLPAATTPGGRGRSGQRGLQRRGG